MGLTVLGGILRGYGKRAHEDILEQQQEEKERKAAVIDVIGKLIPQVDSESQGPLLNVLLGGMLDTKMTGEKVWKAALPHVSQPKPKKQPDLPMPSIRPPTGGPMPQLQPLPALPELGVGAAEMPPPQKALTGAALPPPPFALAQPSIPGITEMRTPLQLGREEMQQQAINNLIAQEQVKQAFGAPPAAIAAPWRIQGGYKIHQVTGETVPLSAGTAGTIDLREIAQQLGAENPEVFAAVPEAQANSIISAIAAGDRAKATSDLRLEIVRRQMQMQQEQREADRQLRLQLAQITRQERPSTQAERTALNYYMRVQNGNAAAEALARDIAKQGLLAETWRKYAPNWAQSPIGQVFNQAVEQFAMGLLRKESGATITDAERIMTANTYFPQPGDGPDVLKRKADARATVMKGLRIEAGRAYKEEYGDVATQYKFYATNPTTGERRGSNDGVTWVPIQ